LEDGKTYWINGRINKVRPSLQNDLIKDFVDYLVEISSDRIPSPLALNADTQKVYSVNSYKSVRWYWRPSTITFRVSVSKSD